MCSHHDLYPDALSRLAANHTIPAEVPELVRALLSGMRETLGDNLIGVYLRGSLALGDFDPLTSDIDFFGIVERRLTETEFAAIAAMHNQLARLPNRYAEHLEGAYIDRAATRSFRPGESHPTIARQERLTWYAHDYNWILERWTVREHGLILYGPAPDTLIDPISTTDLRIAVRLRLREWEQWANQPEDPDWLLPRSHKAYVIETMCRALCTLSTGELRSKPQSISWALATLPHPWRATVERARQWHNDDTPDPAITQEVARFIHWTVSRGM